VNLLPPTLFPRPSWPEVSRAAAVLRRETAGGALLLAAALIALVLANSPWAEGYFADRDFAFGPQLLHLHLSLAQWAADGLLSIFFFVVGKTLGILSASYLVARFTRASLDPDLRWVDVAGLAMLAGIGFTVSLLIGELAFGIGSEREEQVKVGVLAGSLLAALLATSILRARNRTYRRVRAAEERDSDDGIPDVYES
jgi:Na+/H+ antiporter NhaA